MSTLWTRTNTVLLLAVLLVVIAGFATRARGGPLDPPGSPGSTLPQVEPRVPVDVLPFTISQPGSYVLTKTLSAGSGNGITIDANDVTLDLNGFALLGPGNASSGINDAGIIRTNVTIRNGSIRGWGAGINTPELARSTFANLDVADSSGDGMNIGSGGVVREVVAHDNVAAGIRIVQQASNWGTLVTESNISRNGFGYAFEIGGIYIQANNVWVRNNVLDSNAQGGVTVTIGWSFNEITDNRITGNGGSGVALSGTGTTLKNLVARNIIVGNANAVTDFGTGSRIGTFVGSDASITATNPWSNVVY